MADRSHRSYKTRRNNFYSSYSSRSDSIDSNFPKASNPISNTSSRITYSKKSTTSSSKTDDFSSKAANNYNDDGDHDLPNLIGTCNFMCPVEEKERRERLRDLAVFERLNGNPAKTSRTLAVKKFCRTINSKDMKASDVRPVPVLEDTLNYLLNLLRSSDRPFDVIHDFIFDRTRSIRQDLSMQNIVTDRVLCMYERMVKFHIISYHHFRSSETPNTASMSHLNKEQLLKALTTLFSLYEENRASHSISQNKAEFFSLYLLLHLDPDNQVEPLSLWFRRIPSSVMESREMCFALRILRYYRLGNYKRFICATEEVASYMQYCIIEPYISQVRILALSCINYGGYKLQPYPLMHLSKLLMMKESDVEALSVDCDLETSNDGTGKGLVSSKQTVVNKLSKEYPKYYQLDSPRIQRLCAELPAL